MRALSSLFAISFVLLAGCGGGGASTSIQEVENDYGIVSTRSTGAVGAPLIVSAGNLTVMGLAGATFTEARLNFPPMSALNHDEVLARTRLGINWKQYAAVLNYVDRSVTVPIADPGFETDTSWAPSLAPQGDRMFQTLTNVDTGVRLLEMVMLDGSTRSVLSTPYTMQEGVDVSPDGNTLVFTVEEDQLVKMPAVGGTPTILKGEGSNCFRPRWSPDGTRIAYIRNGMAYVIDADGTDEAAVTTLDDPDVTMTSVDWMDNSRVVLTLRDGTENQVAMIPIGGTFLRALFGTTDYEPQMVTVSPDAGMIAFVADDDEGFRLYLLPITGGTPERILDGESVTDVNWGPYIRQKNIIGSAGSLPSGAGFLLGQQGKEVTSYVSFDAVTRSASTIIPGTGSGTGNLVFDVSSSDGINQIRFSNDLFAKAVNPISTTVAGFLVSFDTDTGEVAAVIPYKGSSPKVRAEGTRLMVEGELLGVWNGKGEHRSSPAKQVVL